jgi:hypothetical protein
LDVSRWPDVAGNSPLQTDAPLSDHRRSVPLLRLGGKDIGTAIDPLNEVAVMNDSDTRSVQIVRSWTGFLVVAFGDAAVTLVVAFGLDGLDASSRVAILTSSFTAVATLTTAYFGIRAMANTAQASMGGNTATGSGITVEIAQERKPNTNDFTLSATVSGGSGPYTFGWHDGTNALGQGSSITANLPPGPHVVSVTATDTNTGESVTRSTNIVV